MLSMFKTPKDLLKKNAPLLKDAMPNNPMIYKIIGNLDITTLKYVCTKIIEQYIPSLKKSNIYSDRYYDDSSYLVDSPCYSESILDINYDLHSQLHSIVADLVTTSNSVGFHLLSVKANPDIYYFICYIKDMTTDAKILNRVIKEISLNYNGFKSMKQPDILKFNALKNIIVMPTSFYLEPNIQQSYSINKIMEAIEFNICDELVENLKLYAKNKKLSLPKVLEAIYKTALSENIELPKNLNASISRVDLNPLILHLDGLDTKIIDIGWSNRITNSFELQFNELSDTLIKFKLIFNKSLCETNIVNSFIRSFLELLQNPQ